MKIIYLFTGCFALLFVQAQISQPSQPLSGPGGKDYIHGSVTIYDYGTNGNGSDFWLYEPANPTPDSANVVVFIHGLGMTNPKYYGAFIKHLVRKGNIVIYPRYQKDLTSSNSTFNDSCAKGILRALDTLKLPGHVKPRLQNFFILGHSVGGILTANMTMLHQQYGLPKPLTAFSMQPGASSFLMSSYAAFPPDVKYLIAVGENDIIVGTGPGQTLYNQTTQAPTTHKNLIKHVADNHGSPPITATHDEPGAPDNDFDNGETNLFIQFTNGKVDAVDYFCFWKLQDALMDCALHNQNCDYAFGDTPNQHGMGYWSDGVPVKKLVVTPSSTSGTTAEISENIKIILHDNFIQIMYPLGWQHSEKLTLRIFDTAGRLVQSYEPGTTDGLVPFTGGSGLFYYLLTGTGGSFYSGKLYLQK
ncbi:MAG: hypothetical protein NZM35_03065 [Chitinophagales bacterium]|nr:hypothetical protein [Chitinophagales bacterium]MDW8418466.1 hypothetical protein [Chitinophagales bacterium]